MCSMRFQWIPKRISVDSVDSLVSWLFLCVSFQGLTPASCKGVHICKQRLRNLSDVQKGNDEWQPFLSMSKRISHHAGVLHEMEGILMSVHTAENKRCSSPSDFVEIAGGWKPCFDSPSPGNIRIELNCYCRRATVSTWVEPDWAMLMVCIMDLTWFNLALPKTALRIGESSIWCCCHPSWLWLHAATPQWFGAALLNTWPILATHRISFHSESIIKSDSDITCNSITMHYYAICIYITSAGCVQRRCKYHKNCEVGRSVWTAHSLHPQLSIGNNRLSECVCASASCGLTCIRFLRGSELILHDIARRIRRGSVWGLGDAIHEL